MYLTSNEGSYNYSVMNVSIVILVSWRSWLNYPIMHCTKHRGIVVVIVTDTCSVLLVRCIATVIFLGLGLNLLVIVFTLEYSHVAVTSMCSYSDFYYVRD